MRIAYLALIELDAPNACLIHTREIAEQMAELGNEVHLFLPAPLKPQRWRHVHHHWIRFWGFDRFRQLCFFMESYWKLWREHKKNPFDILYLRETEYAPLLVRFCRWLRLPLFIEVNGWLLDILVARGASKKQILQAQRMQQLLFSHARGLVVCIKGIAEKIHQSYEIPYSSILVQGPGTNTKLFYPDDPVKIREEMKIPVDRCVVIYVGSFNRFHDIPLLVEAFGLAVSKNGALELYMVGDGQQKPKIQQMVREKKLNEKIHLIGFVQYEKVAGWLRCADIAVLPLTALKIRQQNGALASKLWDYMASGLPVVVTDYSDTASYPLLNKITYVTKPENAQEMADALLRLSCDYDLRKKLGGAGRHYVSEKRTWRDAARETCSFIQERLY